MQCKQWRAQQVPVIIVRELYWVMAAQRAACGYVVTSGRFTQDAISFAEGRNIELIDGSDAARASARTQEFHGCANQYADDKGRHRLDAGVATMQRADGPAGRKAWRKCQE